MTASTIIDRIAGKIDEAAEMAKALQQTLNHDEPGATARHDFAISVQNLDRIEQTMSDCAHLLRHVATKVDHIHFDASEISPSLHLQEIKDMLRAQHSTERTQSGTVEWL